MDAQRDITGQGSHLDGEHALGDHFAGANTYDSNPENPLRLRVDEQLGHALGAVKRDRAARCGPGKLRDLYVAIFLLRLRLGEAAPGDLGIGKYDCRDCVWLEGDFVPRDGFDRDAAFVRRLVRKHWLADYVADRVDGGIIGLELLIHLNESALADLHAGLVEAGNLGVRLASYRDQHPIENFFLRVAVLCLQRGTNTLAFILHRSDRRVQKNSFEHLFQSLIDRKSV